MSSASSGGVSIGVPEAVRQAAHMVVSGTAIEPLTRNAIALRNLSRVIFATDGRILGLDAEEFSRREGLLLFRGVSFFRFIRENLNGEWFGTGLMSDGNHYTGYEAREVAIDEYGFSRPHGWAMAYRLDLSASLVEHGCLDSITLEQFVDSAAKRFDADEDSLAVLHQKGDNDGFRAILLGYDGMVDRYQDHYVIYNHRTLVYSVNCTPWAYGLEQLPEELAASEGKAELTLPDRVGGYATTESSRARLMYEWSRFQNEGMDKTRGIGLEYAKAAEQARWKLLEMKP